MCAVNKESRIELKNANLREIEFFFESDSREYENSVEIEIAEPNQLIIESREIKIAEDIECWRKTRELCSHADCCKCQINGEVKKRLFNR